MNTRLQVEHPVTEAVTGIDLVRAQLRDRRRRAAAPRAGATSRRAGMPSSAASTRRTGAGCCPRQDDGRDIASRTGTGVRIDSGVAEGRPVTVHYDPLLAKLIAHGDSRDEATISRMTRWRGYDILGVHHNIAFLRRLLARAELRSVDVHTQFIEEHLDELHYRRPRRCSAPRQPWQRSSSLGGARTARRSTPVDADVASAGRDDPWGPRPTEAGTMIPWAPGSTVR